MSRPTDNTQAAVEWTERALSRKEYSTEYITSLHGDPVWQAIWTAIKEWDICTTPGAYSYHGPTGDDATHIYEAVKAASGIPLSALIPK
jgi:hypothetical protein